MIKSERNQGSMAKDVNVICQQREETQGKKTEETRKA
jgi:hypothetical protein